MATSTSSMLKSVPSRPPFPHLHATGEICPWCEQPLPDEKLEEIKERIEAKERERLSEITTRLQDQFSRAQAEAETKAKADLEQVRQEAATALERERTAAAAKVEAARDEARLVAEAAAQEKFEAAERVNRESQAALLIQIEQTEARKVEAEQTGLALQAQLAQILQDSAAAIATVKQEAAAREPVIRAEAQQVANAAVQERLAGLERARQESEAALQTRIEEADTAKAAAEQASVGLKMQLEQQRQANETALAQVKEAATARESTVRQEATALAEASMQQKITDADQAKTDAEAKATAAEQVGVDLKAQLEQQRQANEMALAQVKEAATARESTVRQEATALAEASLQQKIADADQAKTDAETRATTAEQQMATFKETHEAQLNQRLHEQREAFEQAKTEAVNAEKAAAFEEKLRLSGKIDELQRTVDKKTAEELGEGAEIDLYEVLKANFDGDRIERVNKGAPGADIIHTVIHNGRECGKIIYDSKNHNAWRNAFVTKLAADQMNARADHAILSTRKFPDGARHLHVQDGVILATPARVAALVEIIRRHIVQGHTMRLSNEERTQKTAALYSFITSPRCAELFARIDTHAEDLFDLQAKEMKAHKATWTRQGELIRSVQKVRTDICNEIDGIIGTAEVSVSTP